MAVRVLFLDVSTFFLIKKWSKKSSPGECSAAGTANAPVASGAAPPADAKLPVGSCYSINLVINSMYSFLVVTPQV